MVCIWLVTFVANDCNNGNASLTLSKLDFGSTFFMAKKKSFVILCEYAPIVAKVRSDSSSTGFVSELGVVVVGDVVVVACEFTVAVAVARRNRCNFMFEDPRRG
jgi:hypothetical protein